MAVVWSGEGQGSRAGSGLPGLAGLLGPIRLSWTNESYDYDQIK